MSAKARATAAAAALPPACYQVNLQQGFGGGEVYTLFFTRALIAAGVRPVLFVHAQARQWTSRLPAQCEVVPVAAAGELAALLPRQRCWLAFHTPVAPEEIVGLRRAGHLLSAFAHMPLYGRNPAQLAPYDWILPVSRHVAASLEAAGLRQVYGEAMYGIADLSGRDLGCPIVRASPYDWDTRKVRDRALSYLYPLWDMLQLHPRFARAPGITLGIVSRLTPIKQLPLLFTLLAPALCRQPRFRLEIFGSGGYASVRDLRHALSPLAGRVRFWGQQEDVGSVYRQLDYLMTGLPEKEALGLNVIEAQACGTPVLAVAAPPFTETVASEVSGLFYSDPRADGGLSFARLLSRLEQEPFHIDATKARAHLRQFSEAAFAARVARLCGAVASRLARAEPAAAAG